MFNRERENVSNNYIETCTAPRIVTPLKGGTYIWRQVYYIACELSS